MQHAYVIATGQCSRNQVKGMEKTFNALVMYPHSNIHTRILIDEVSSVKIEICRLLEGVKTSPTEKIGRLHIYPGSGHLRINQYLLIQSPS